MVIIVHYPERIDPKLLNPPTHPEIHTEPFEGATNSNDYFFINGRRVEKSVYDNLILALKWAPANNGSDNIQFINLVG